MKQFCKEMQKNNFRNSHTKSSQLRALLLVCCKKHICTIRAESAHLMSSLLKRYVNEGNRVPSGISEEVESMAMRYMEQMNAYPGTCTMYQGTCTELLGENQISSDE